MQTSLILIIITSFLLSGCLPAITGATAGAAMEFAKDRTAGDTVADTKISMAIKTELMKSDFKNLYTKTKIEVVNGRVLLTGVVSSQEDVAKAVQIAWNQKGVVEVINELKVDKDSNKFDLIQYTRDSLITTQIKSRIFANRSIKFVNYTVITDKNVVYLFGMARSEEELAQVADIAAGVRGVEKVISHVKVISLPTEKISPAEESKDNELLNGADSIDESDLELDIN